MEGDVREDLMNTKQRQSSTSVSRSFSTNEQASSTEERNGNGNETHPSLESSDLVVSEGITLCDNGDEVDLLVQTSHELDVDGFEAGGTKRRKQVVSSSSFPSLPSFPSRSSPTSPLPSLRDI